MSALVATEPPPVVTRLPPGKRYPPFAWKLWSVIAATVTVLDNSATTVVVVAGLS